jgi:hypothetical protein
MPFDDTDETTYLTSAEILDSYTCHMSESDSMDVICSRWATINHQDIEPIRHLFKPDKFIRLSDLLRHLGISRSDMKLDGPKIVAINRVKYNLTNIEDGNTVDDNNIDPRLAIQMIKIYKDYDVSSLIKEYGRADLPEFLTQDDAPDVLAYIDIFIDKLRQPIFVFQPNKKWYIALFDVMFFAYLSDPYVLGKSFAEAEKYENILKEKVITQDFPDGGR